jgi:NADH-ubiquinone oxidoreductase chain 5
VFLIIRCSPLFELAPKASLIITLMGAATAFFAATTALLQNDLKKVVAYSTCSQLGYMVFACGISNYSASIFHLMNHAFFKALLFLSAGAVIHGFMDEQDMRKMGGLVRVLPFTYISVLIGSMSLVGFPFLTGFYSKDFILELAFAKYSASANFAHWLGTLSVFFTCFYSFRLIFLTFLNKTNAYRPVVAHAHEVGPLTAFPLVVLAFGSIFVGYITRDAMIGLGTNFWGNALFMLPVNEVHTNAEFLTPFVKNIPLVFTLMGAFLSFVLIHKGNWTVFASSDLARRSRALRRMYIFLNRKWYFDKVYARFVVSFFLSLGYNVTFKAIDKGIIELLGPYGISVCIYDAAGKIAKLQTGYIYHYAFVIFVGCFTAVGALLVFGL